MNAFLNYEWISQVSLSNNDEKREKRPPCQEINIDEELDKLFPPKSIRDEGEVKTIRASRKQANLFDIHRLNDVMNTTLENGQPGFSSERLDVHTHLFDELIRQEIIVCPERGLMMVTIRDELLETLKWMKKLKKSCFALAIRKDLQVRREIVEMRKDIAELTEGLKGANAKLKNIQQEWVERKRLKEEEEGLRWIQQTFFQNQLVLSNQQMVKQMEDVIDTEHRWLKNID